MKCQRFNCNQFRISLTNCQTYRCRCLKGGRSGCDRIVVEFRTTCATSTSHGEVYLIQNHVINCQWFSLGIPVSSIFLIRYLRNRRQQDIIVIRFTFMYGNNAFKVASQLPSFGEMYSIQHTVIQIIGDFVTGSQFSFVITHTSKSQPYINQFEII